MELNLTSHVTDIRGKPVSPSANKMILTDFEFKPTLLSILTQTSTQTLLGLAFTTPVRAEDLTDKLTIRSLNGESVPFRLVPGESRITAFISIDRQTALPVEAHVATGLPEAG